MSSRKSFIVYTNWEEKLSSLNDGDFGKLFRAIFRYVNTGQQPDSTPMVNLAFGFIKATLDADKEKYETRCIRSAKANAARWAERDGRGESLNADQKVPNDIQCNPNNILNSPKGIQSNPSDIQDTSLTPVITDNCKLITDNCVSTDVDTSYCTEPKSGSAQKTPKKPTEEAVFELPLIGGTEYGVTQEQIDQWAELYPSVDVMQALRGMLGWLNANPTRRKTRRGITRFINNWLSRDQDSGRNQRTAQTNAAGNAPLEDWEREWLDQMNAIDTGTGELNGT